MLSPPAFRVALREVRADRHYRCWIVAPHQSRWRVTDHDLEVIVSLNRDRVLAAVPIAWPSLVLIVLAARSTLPGTPIVASEYMAWLFLAGAPVLITLGLMRGQSEPSIAKVLYDTEQADPAAAAAVRERLRQFSANELDRS